MTMIIILIWFVLGFTGYIYWETDDKDLTLSELLFGILVGIAGPFTWFCGGVITGISGPVIFKRRKK